MKKNIILTDAPTFKGIQEQIGQADLGFYRVLDLQRIKTFLFDHWDEIAEFHLYNEGTKIGLEWLMGNINLENTEPNRVRALYGQVEAIITVNCSKGIDPGFLENWENGACTFELNLVQVKKPGYTYEDPEDFLRSNE